MTVKETKLKDCFILSPQLFEDDRGYFFESFNQSKFNKLTKQNIQFVQDNESKSVKGVLRGLHFQKGEYAQAKLVRVIQGEILDVVVDIRKGSETFGQHASFILNQDNNAQLFIPRGFAHGFLVLSNTAIFAYKCDNYYNKNSESGIIYNDPQLNIDWGLKDAHIILSDKDKLLPKFKDLVF